MRDRPLGVGHRRYTPVQRFLTGSSTSSTRQGHSRVLWASPVVAAAPTIVAAFSPVAERSPLFLGSSPAQAPGRGIMYAMVWLFGFVSCSSGQHIAWLGVAPCSTRCWEGCDWDRFYHVMMILRCKKRPPTRN